MKRIKEILQNTQEQGNESTALDDFNHRYGEFIKQQAQARARARAKAEGKDQAAAAAAAAETDVKEVVAATPAASNAKIGRAHV